MKSIAIGTAAALALFVTAARAAPAAPQTFPLYDHPPAGWEHPAQVELTEGWPPNNHRMFRNVTRPTLTAFLPDPAKATGAGVLVLPGGGFFALSIDEEGEDLARWLAERGIAAFVLKYRLRPTNPDPKAFEAELAKLFSGRIDPNGTLPGETEAVADGHAALDLLRARAPSFGVDPTRLGVVGFSAGGMMAVALATDPGPKPAFVGDIYAPVRTKTTVPADAPPVFAAQAADDPLFGNNGTATYDAWKKAGRPVEQHLYEKGGHGFGMRKQGTTSDGWIEDFHAWLTAHGWLKRAG